MTNDEKLMNYNKMRSKLNIFSINGFFCLLALITLRFIFKFDWDLLFTPTGLILLSFGVIVICIGFVIFRKNTIIDTLNSNIKKCANILAVSYIFLGLISKIGITWIRILLSIVIMSVSWFAIKEIKKVIGKYSDILTAVSACIDIIESFIFYLFLEILVLTLIITPIHEVEIINNNWTPILSISLTLLIIAYEYRSVLIQVKPILVYVILWIIVPLIFFGLYMQNYVTGGYNTFHSLFLAIAAIDSLVLAILSKEMQALLGIRIHDKENIIAFTKILLANITMLVALTNGIFEKSRLSTFISNTCSVLNWIGKEFLYFLNLQLNFSIAGKMTIFISIIFCVMIAASFLLVYIEKWILKRGEPILREHGYID